MLCMLASLAACGQTTGEPHEKQSANRKALSLALGPNVDGSHAPLRFLRGAEMMVAPHWWPAALAVVTQTIRAEATPEPATRALEPELQCVVGVAQYEVSIGEIGSYAFQLSVASLATKAKWQALAGLAARLRVSAIELYWQGIENTLQQPIVSALIGELGDDAFAVYLGGHEVEDATLKRTELSDAALNEDEGYFAKGSTEHVRLFRFAAEARHCADPSQHLCWRSLHDAPTLNATALGDADAHWSCWR